MTEHNSKHADKNFHTLLIGTSKTQEGEKYFCKGANIKKFWGTLSQINTEFNGKEQTEELIAKGIFFRDISSAEGGQEKRDKEIKAISLQQGFYHLEQILSSHPELKRIGFIGKQAAKWFFIYFLKYIQFEDTDIKIKDGVFKDYGKQNWYLELNQKRIDCHFLRNTGRQWVKCPKDWEAFWKEVFS